VRVELTASRGGEAFPVEVSVVGGRLGGMPFWTAFVRDLTGARREQEAKRAAEQSYRMLFEGSPLAMLCYDAATGTMLDVNDAAVRLYGYSREEFTGLSVRDITSAVDDESGSGADGNDAGSRPEPSLHRAKSGRSIEVAVTVQAVTFGDRPACFMIAEDVGERESLARQLRQSQRLESLGELAGGVAHDFNNLLGVIMSYAGFVKEEVDQAGGDWARSRSDLEQIELAAQSAVRMTRQLLVFSKRDIAQTEIVSVNDVVVKLKELLGRTLGDHIELATELLPDLSPVAIDPGQLEQVIVNLAVNARDAMPAGGRITIETDTVTAGVSPASSEPGPCVRLRVRDTGTGMDEATMDRAFEPFFSTKPKDKGTGLGLATIYGIVTQAGGSIDLSSVLGVGTTVTVTLPACEEPAGDDTPSEVIPDLVHGHETVLLVEDEDALREVVVRMLERHGYEVLTASTGAEATDLAASYDGEIHALVTDVMLPRMLGPEVAACLRERRPSIRVIYISGYAQPILAAQGALDEGVVLVEKPFTETTLLGKLRDALAGDQPSVHTGIRDGVPSTEACTERE
jgi:PAS domain S-box-containing protein